MKTKVLIIGAGPAGLTAALELLKENSQLYDVTIIEADCQVGGISKTVVYNGNRMDMGGHRFFSKVPEVNKWWNDLLPVQGAPSKDDLLLERSSHIAHGGPDPEKTDDVMLKRHRISRILFMDKFYDYPISLKKETFFNMGFVNTIKCGFSYMLSMIHKLPEINLENFYINRFGKKLYSMFFEYYTENLWGRHPREIDTSWGNQRVKGISIMEVMKNAVCKLIKKENSKVETSLIEEFGYPKLGPGQIWEKAASEIQKLGGKIIMNANVVKAHKEKNKLTGLTYIKDGTETTLVGDIVISSMPLKDLVSSMNDVPEEEARIAQGLPYRDYMTAGVLVKQLQLKNNTDIKTFGNIVPDCWIYVQDRNVKLGRIQIYNNWSPYLVQDPMNTVWIGLEYFVQEGDKFWSMSDEEFVRTVSREIIKLGIISSEDQILDSHVERVKKAYPAYFDTYKDISKLRDYLNTIPNLYCVGRNGQHRYNNMDHSMCTSFEAVKNIILGDVRKDNIWNVNTEKQYHEEDNRK